MNKISLALCPFVLVLACSSSEPSSPTSPAPDVDAGADAAAPTGKTDAELEAEALKGMHDAIALELAALVTHAKELQAAAPTPTGRGWDAAADAAAIAAMKKAWLDCRVAYEHVEGAVAPLLPDIDTKIDARYDDYLTALGGAGDADLFDDKGVIGMHAIERILFSTSIGQAVVDFESTLPGYAPAAFPATEAEAQSFKTKLAQKLVDDVSVLEAQWQPANINVGIAYNGLVSLMSEQHEKVTKAATGAEESRYAQVTLFDLRNNLEGVTKVYASFQPWLRSKTSSDKAKDGPSIDASITAGFAALRALYDGYQGDALPAVPPTWSSIDPSEADKATPFGKLFVQVGDAVDPAKPGSIVAQMNVAATILGFPEFVQK